MINWKGHQWLQKERWGSVHPEKPHWWYDPSASYIDAEDNLNLLTQRNPKYFAEIDKISTIGVGLFSCQSRFGWGEFEIEAKLPYGDHLWPAFWMWSWDSWPPEIDILEAYSDNNPNYFKLRLLKPLGFWNVQTNVHYIDKNLNKMSGGKTHFLGFKDPTKNWIKYSVKWLPNKLEFYYNGRLVRKITDTKILEQLNLKKMNVIINNGVTAGVNLEKSNYSNFVIRDFTYNPF